MGQYSRRLLEHLAWQRRREQEWRLIRQIADAVKNPKHIELDPLLSIIPDPTQLEKTVRRIFPKAQTTWRKYHWWQEPDGAIRKIDAAYLHSAIKDAMRRKGAENPYQLAKKTGAPRGKVSIIRDWLRQAPTVSAKTGTLKRILDILGIPYSELEARAAILDRKFPVDLYSSAIVKLYTQALNEGHLKRDTPTQTSLRYVNQDPALIRAFIDNVKAAGGWAKILEPAKPGFDAYTDTVTPRILAAAGLPYGRKTLTNPHLHPAVFKNKEAAKQHLKLTFLEEGYTTFSYGRNRLQLIIGINRSRDITQHIPPQTLNQLQQHKGQKIQPTQYFTQDFIDKELIPNAPKALREERDLIAAFIREKYSVELQPSIVISYLHISKKGEVTANYRLAMRSSEVIDLFKDIVLTEPLGTWKEHRFNEMLKIYQEYRGRALTQEEKQEVAARTPPHKIPENWLIRKAKQLLGDIAPWTRDEEKLKIITRWYKKQ